MTTFGAVLAILLAAPPASTSADPAALPLVEITSIVTDRDGRAIPGLGTADFELLEDGALRPLERVEPRPPGSLYIVLLDELHVAREETVAVRTALLRFVDERLTPSDRIVVFKPLDPLTSIPFTGDAAGARAAIASFEGRLDDLGPRSALEAQVIGTSPRFAGPARARLVTLALRELAGRARAVRDRRATLILVSQGFTPDTRDLLAAIRSASGADVPVHWVAPRAVPDAAGAEEPESGLRRLARDTGGRVTAGELPDHLARIAGEGRGAYRVVYQPSGVPDGRFRAIQVRTTRPNLLVRARPGFWAYPDPSTWLASAAPSVPLAPRRALRRSPLIRTWVGLRPAAGGRVQVVVTWEESGRAAAPARHPAQVAVRASLAGGGVLYDGALAPVGRAAEGEPRVAVFDAPSGRIELDLVVHAADGTVLDRDARDVEPAAGGGRARLYPVEIVRARTAREFRQAVDDADAAPSPSREFRRTERLLVRAHARDPAGLPLAVHARLVNVAGQAMRELPAIPGGGGSMPPRFELLLAPLAPGEYAVVVEAGSLSERVRFRVTH